MGLDEGTRERLEVALTEAEVVGLHQSPDPADAVDVLLHVLALHEIGPVELDARRILRLSGASDVRVVLRPWTPEELGAPVKLADLDSVETFFESLSVGDSLYGGRYFDEPSLTADWPDSPSFHLSIHSQPAPHQFYWFNECSRHEQGELHRYVIEGTVDFGDLAVLNARGEPQELDQVIADGARWWRGLQDSDPRVSLDAQRAARNSQSFWRRWSSRPPSPDVNGRS